MQEKFHQFNRKDNSKKIEEGLAEMEVAVEKNTASKNDAKPKVVEVSENPERIAVTDEEKEKLFSRLEKPKDILSLPTSLRREGLASLREKIAKRYLSISNMQTAVFDRIGELDSGGGLNEESLRKEIAAKADEHNFSSEDRKVIDDLLYYFFRNFRRLKEVRDLSEPALLERFIMNRNFLSSIRDDYHVKVTPFSVHFDFYNLEDFRLFVSSSEGEARETYKRTYGLSYYLDNYPITASGWYEQRETTLIHEIQHKKFESLTSDKTLLDERTLPFDKILVDERTERAARDEVLARFSERGEKAGIFGIVMSYGFAERFGANKVSYEKMLRDAVNAIQELQFMHFKKEEILGLLSKEKLSTWPKIVKRIKGTKVEEDLFQQRKKRRVKRNKKKI